MLGVFVCIVPCTNFQEWVFDNVEHARADECTKTSQWSSCSVHCLDGFSLSSLNGSEWYTCDAVTAPQWSKSDTGEAECSPGEHDTLFSVDDICRLLTEMHQYLGFVSIFIHTIHIICIKSSGTRRQLIEY